MAVTRTQGTVAVLTNGHEFTVRHRLPVIRHLRAEGMEVVGVAPSGSPALDVFEETGCPTMEVEYSRSGTNPIQELGAITSVMRCYRILRPRLVIHATVKPVVYGTFAASRLEIPVVNLITGLGFAYTGSGARAYVLRALLRQAYRAVFRYRRQRVILQNHDDLQELVSKSGLPPTLASVVPGSGVDLECFVPSVPGRRGTADSALVVLPGRMLLDKGIVEFCAAARILKERFPQARFSLVGPTDEGNPASIPPHRLATLAGESGVEVWGQVADMRDVYAEASMVVLPSRREGMPKVILEAAASGLPTVATCVPGSRESILHGETGFLVPLGDGNALVDAIERLLADPLLGDRMGRRARALAEERFGAEEIAHRIIQTAMELI